MRIASACTQQTVCITELLHRFSVRPYLRAAATTFCALSPAYAGATRLNGEDSRLAVIERINRDVHALLLS